METPQVKQNRFIGARVKRQTQFVGLKIEIQKLSMAQVEELKDIALSSSEELRDQLVLEYVLKSGAPELAEIENFAEFPLDELGKLATEIMSFSGLEVNGAPKQ
jgi:hypothetical protein